MLNKKIASEITVGIIVLITVVVGGIFWLQSVKTENIEQSYLPTGQPLGTVPIEKNVQMCTQEAKLCDDGSYVSRTGPNCEFAACPVVDSAYYNKLKQKCDGSSCCLSSVNIMEKGKYIEYPSNGQCEDGFKSNMLRCVDSYRWCEPKI